ncbi:hypothetical protein CFELI_09575 [Corynebacterium felinum]|uniref:Uncharacterized protein n=1 Tax=Corynebacterium felinum TaxID=131318 RepID=A0ABU2BC19_9CORY|nr:hypothetical protein [Corynebacterium felinum]WJY95518.1 hypothetical protein CFELI_09575 [Corynebacterium felinum]
MLAFLPHLTCQFLLHVLSDLGFKLIANAMTFAYISVLQRVGYRQLCFYTGFMKQLVSLLLLVMHVFHKA